MRKLKSNSGAKKRFRRRGKGFKYRKAERNHILTKKPQKRKRQSRKQSSVSKQDGKSIERMLNGS